MHTYWPDFNQGIQVTFKQWNTARKMPFALNFHMIGKHLHGSVLVSLTKKKHVQMIFMHNDAISWILFKKKKKVSLDVIS